MLKGNNQLVLCSADMLNALEYYLNQQVFQGPVKVVDIKEESEYNSTVYRVTIESVDPEQEDLNKFYKESIDELRRVSEAHS